MRVGVYRLAMSHPGDTSALERLVEDGTIDPATIVCSIGKTEGNGGANDFTRALATERFSTVLGRYLTLSPEEVADRIAFAWSGGCEGVLSPHVTIFTRRDGPKDPTGERRLAISVQRTRDLLPEEVGRMPEVEEVAAATRRGLADLAVNDASDVHFVQVKGPLLTPQAIAEAASRKARVVTEDPNVSKAYARGATALGVAIGLGELRAGEVDDDVVTRDLDKFSRVASTSAGGELRSCEVILLANAPGATSGFRVGHGVLADAVDFDGVAGALRSAGLEFDCVPDDVQRARVAAVFAKAEAPPGGRLRGQRTTMLSDADINYERHARAAVGAVIAAMTGDPRIFVSGGTEHQGPPGTAPIAAIVAC